MQPRTRKIVAMFVAMLLLLSACSSGSNESVDPQSLCDLTDGISSGLVLSDALLSRSASARELQNRMTGASRLLDELAGVLESDALRDDAQTVRLAVDDARVVLAGAGYEPYVLLASGSADSQRALTALGSPELTSARANLVAELNSACTLSLEEPTSALGTLAVAIVGAEPVRRSEIVVADLSVVELTALLSSGIGIEAESELLEITNFRSISALLEALRSGEFELTRFAANVITSAIQRSEYGDDASLDRLWDACAAADASACDLLWYTSPRDTAYEQFGATCGERSEGTEFQNRCAQEFG
ncbi:MAG: hypothetical protein ACC652_10530 [Acidimicrobiales bacterium]